MCIYEAALEQGAGAMCAKSFQHAQECQVSNT